MGPACAGFTYSADLHAVSTNAFVKRSHSKMKSKHHRANKKSRRKTNHSRGRPSASAPIIGIPSANRRARRGSSRRSQEGKPPGENEQTPEGNQSGDLTGLNKDDYSAGESTAELIEEGQDLEGELVLGVEDAPDADEGEVPTPRTPRSHIPRYRDRNRL